MGISDKGFERIKSYMEIKSSEDEISGPLFHVTFYSNLYGISEEGLSPGSGSGIGVGAYSSHSAKGVFLTDESGVSFWFSRYQSFAESQSDNVYEDEYTPVVLKIDPLPEEFEYLQDEIGSKDSVSEAFIYPGTIDPSFIQVWFRDSWLDIEDFSRIDTLLSYDVEVPEPENDELTEESEDWSGEEEEVGDPLYWFKQDEDNPLYYKGRE